MSVEMWNCIFDSVEGGVHLPFSLNDTIEQWRDHSVLWQFLTGGSICLWVSMTPFNSEEITLCSDSVWWGLHLPLSLNDTIEQWSITLCSDSVWLGGSICLWVSMTPLNSEEITLCSDSVWMGGSICLWYLHVFSMHWYFLIFSY